MSPTIAVSYLFVPGGRPERFAKALAAGADAVVVDLEDAVAPGDKAHARDALAEWLDDAPPVAVRVNAVGTSWHDADVELCRAPSVLSVMLPKVESAEDAARVARATGKPVIALVETARGVSRAADIAAADGVERLAFGALDLALDLDVGDDAPLLDHCRASLALASRIAGVAAPVDGVTPRIDDPQAAARDARHARGLGFGAKLCIHPRQIAPVHEAFAVSEAERAWAQRVLAAVRDAGEAAGAVDGRMVDAPVIARARRILGQRSS